MAKKNPKQAEKQAPPPVRADHTDPEDAPSHVEEVDESEIPAEARPAYEREKARIPRWKREGLAVSSVVFDRAVRANGEGKQSLHLTPVAMLRTNKADDLRLLGPLLFVQVTKNKKPDVFCVPVTNIVQMTMVEDDDMELDD